MKDFFSTKNIFTTKSITVMALMIAVKVVLSMFSIYITPTFRAVNFAYLPGVVVAVLYGPWAAVVFGFAADILGYIVKPGGPFFIGYTLSEMLSYFVYAVFLFRKPITVSRVILSRIVITIFISFGLNLIWSSILYGTGPAGFFSSARLLNNVIQFPIYVILITVVGKLALRLKKYGIVQGNDV